MRDEGSERSEKSYQRFIKLYPKVFANWRLNTINRTAFKLKIVVN